MQSLELVPSLLISMLVTFIALAVVINSWRQRRLLPTLLYVLTIGCFSAMVIDLLLDQIYMPFRNWGLVVNGHQLWVSNLLLTLFIVGGFISWYFAIMYSQYDTPPTKLSILVAFLSGGALVGELVKGNWSNYLPLVIEVVAFAILIAVIVQYYRRIIRTTTDRSARRVVSFYFLGFVIWISAGPIGLIIASLSGIPWWVGNLWTVPYTLGLLLVSITVAQNPRLLFISEARPLDFIVLDSQGVLVFSHRFHDYPGSMDSELVGSAISGIISLMKELLASGESLQRIDHGDVKILLEHGADITCLLVVTIATSRFRQSLQAALVEFETTYRKHLHSEHSLSTGFLPFKARAEEIFL